MNFHEFACLARCNGLDVKKIQANKSTREQFVQSIKDTCSTTDKVMVIAYSRQALQQTGDGHYSPIGGFDPDTNTALVMDVARFKYPSYWVPVDLLWDSLFPIDAVTKEQRGYYLLERSKSMLSLSLLRLELDWKGWSTFANTGLSRALQHSSMANSTSIEEIIPQIVRRFYGHMNKLSVRQTPQATDDGAEVERTFSEEVHKLLHQASHHPYYSIAYRTLQEMGALDRGAYKVQKKIHIPKTAQCVGECAGGEEVSLQAAMLTIFLLAIPKRYFTSLPLRVQLQVEQYKRLATLPQPLQEEVGRTEHQMEMLSDMSSTHCTDCDCFDDAEEPYKDIAIPQAKTMA